MTADTLADELSTAGLDPAEVLAHEPLAGGTYNTLHRLVLRDGRRLVLKLPPPADTPGLAYERALLVGETAFYRAAAGTAPVPEVVSWSEDHLLMTECAGTSWHEAPPSEGERAGLRRELGALVGRLHAVHGPGFGYPGGALPPSADWRGTFTTMLDAVLTDAERYAAPLPVPPDRIRELAAGAAPALDEVRAPALVHFDLWAGNVLLADGRVSALIDGERMFWGDPLADFASLCLLAPLDRDLLDGYASVGGTVDFTPAARVRMALYRAYLHVIMLAECGPRGYVGDELAWRVRAVTPHLRDALGELAA
ncbi:phosphotransferase family protein [Streptomyces millisiae]|uniref:Aminoglycoside phosphotransferase family protein n=1 Tax=Streptomyces millisiae TaxID=3075542 RepID=A0ABU2LZE2_9ACTN|nr:aminoglycoside phosphotransferase family protein [Streptomyces sp. DSM 44918]MDT0322936.1 aminoglycoside phosphotransferase family protein [Streptomyces sp. DSM 44918]